MIGKFGENKGPTKKAHPIHNSTNSGHKFDYSRSSHPISRISSSILDDEDSPDAASEKELVRTYFLNVMYAFLLWNFFF